MWIQEIHGCVLQYSICPIQEHQSQVHLEGVKLQNVVF